MKDPQRWANKFFSQILHILNSNAKGGLLVETGAAVNRRKLEKDWSKADSIIDLNPGGLGKVQPKPPVVVPPDIGNMMEFAISSIRDASGVSLELLGMADRQQAGYLEAQRTKAGLTILAGLFDALRLYRKKQGRVLIYFIQEYLSDGRLIKVVGKQGEQFVPLIKNPEAVKYDVIVDSAPTSRDMKEKTWAALMEMLPLIQGQGLPIPADIIEYSPLPSGLIASWKPKLMQAQQKAETADPAKQQIDMEAQMSQIRVQEATQIEQAKAGTEMQKAQVEAQSKGVSAQADAQAELVKGQAQLQIEREKMALENERKQAELEMEFRYKAREKQMELDARMQEKLIDAAAKVMAAKCSVPMGGPMQDMEETDGAEQADPGMDMQAMMAEIQAMAKMMASPREVIRDEDGRAIGSRIVNG